MSEAAVHTRMLKGEPKAARSVARQTSQPIQNSSQGLPDVLLRLQHAHGNRFVQRMLKGALVQRKCACGQGSGACVSCSEDQTRLQRKATKADAPAAVPELVHAAAQGNGQPLDSSVREFMESRFQHDFSQVRIHSDAHSARSAAHLNATAYTVGSDIFFGQTRYSPHTQSGRKLLAHELAHVLQQSQMPMRSAQWRVSEPQDTLEQEADSIAEAVIDNRRPGKVSRVRTSTISRFTGPMPVTVRPPLAVPGPTVRYAPVPSNSLAEIAERAEMNQRRSESVREGERPVATLERGGSPPDFITVSGRSSSIGEFGHVFYNTYAFHILEAIEYEVGRANTERELEEVLQTYITPNHPILLLQRRFPILRFQSPIIPEWLDRGAEVRLRVYTEAVARRARQVPALQRITRAAPQRASDETTRRRCTVTPASGLGNDPLATLFCQAATNSLFEYRVTSPTYGGATFDAMRGNTLFECKCGYRSLVRAHGQARGFAALQLDRMDEQVRRHLRIANDCGLQYRFMVSNPELADILRTRWSDVTVLEHQFEPCD